MITFLFLIFLFFSFSHVQAENWPHLRGPDYNGHADNEEIVIPEKGSVPLIWKRSFDQGYSGSVIADGRLFTQGQNRSGQYVICLDALTGEELWRTRYGWPWELDGRYHGTYGTPTFSTGKLYFSGCYGTVGCLDSKTGKIIWSFDLKKRFKTEVTSFGYACTPLVENGRVYLTLGGEAKSVIALNAADGSTIWQSGTLPASYSSPLPFHINGQIQIVSFLKNFLVANDPESGKQLWAVRFSEGYDEHSTWPLFKDNLICCASPFFRGMKGMKVPEDNSSSEIKQIWKTKKMSNDIFSSVIVGEHIYGFNITDPQANPDGNTDGFFKCLEVATGRQLWETEKTGHVSVLAVKNTLILLSETGTLIYIKASPKGYEELWRGEIFPNDICWPCPAICDGRLYLRSEESIACVALNEKADNVNIGFQDSTESSSFSAIVDKWLTAYQGDTFIAPKLNLIFLWYLFSLLIFAISAILAYLITLKTGKAYLLFLILSTFLSLLAPIIISPLAGKFIFTLPSVIFISFIAVLQFRYVYINKKKSTPPSGGGGDTLDELSITARSAKEKGREGCSILALNGKIRQMHCLSRLALAGFILICVSYFLICDRLFIVSGIGFLFGIIPAAPLAIIFVKSLQNIKSKKIVTAILFLAAYSLFFWSGALLVLLKTG